MFAKSLFFARPQLLGLDIQASGIRLLGLKKHENQYLLQHLSSHHFDIQSIFVENKIKHWDVLLTLLTDIVQALQIKGAPVAIQLPLHLVSLERISVAVGLSERAIEAEIRAAIHKDWPDSEALCLDFFCLPRKNALEEVMFVASKAEYLSLYLNCIHAAGLKVCIVDIDIFTLLRVINYLYSCATENNLLIYTNNFFVSIVLFNAKNILFFEYWEVAQSCAAWQQLIQKINVSLMAFSQVHITRGILCGEADNLMIIGELLKPLINFNLEHLNIDQYIHNQQSAFIDAQQSQLFHIAYGLAMREMPLWWK